MNFAVISKIDSDLQNDSSLCGEVKTRFGGVARNIALKLAEYKDIQIDFITVLSKDILGDMAKKELESFCIDYGHSFFTEEWKSFYCETITQNGHYGINDMKQISNLTPEYIGSLMEYIDNHDIVVVDANLDQNTLEYIASNAGIPVVCDVTSIQKCRRIVNVLDKIDIVKMNNKEACMLSGVEAGVKYDINVLKSALLNTPMKNCYVTLGEFGSFYLSRTDYCHHEPHHKIDAKNVLGAGDSFTAGIIEGTLNNLPIDAIKEKT
jgi:pseudouridine kinase